MNIKSSLLLTACALLGISATAHAGLVVNTTTDANTLANAIAGSGITISNAVFSTDTSGIGAGTFSGGNSTGLGFDTGILLTSGAASNAIGPNDSESTSGGGTFSKLSFDFTSTTGQVFFSYVFASEEYNEYVGSNFNDSFTLSLDGTNIALLPDNTPVTINNVNLGSNSAYYLNNSPGPFDLEYDGLTTVLTAFSNLTPGTHNFEFFITDVGDSIYDSGVFIKAGSFSGTNPTDVPEPASLALFGAGLLGLGFLRRRKDV